ncbi:hypothetical protein DICSQDRAFT_148934 [Dichomitus squalens LYAD-421 SS1]|uniref:Uncharacterized protein n=1 Tax=Dichomitus squalens (strain LYAD-421) TaxID=732165 RepID=R7SRD5_DICSQ|nr:uncharacterized protein DICSQDRAFT_148934 [Dichomitus squalens LYAD-421 SS1]EJF58719.1 hypothetical protein DICSQDRAFT_148934 [Dichomitus squalens LYAD-421 SS1]
MMEWQYTGSMTKSAGELQRLVDNVILDDRFQKDDLQGFSVEREQHRLDEHKLTGGVFSAKDGWREASVPLHLPKPGVQQEDEEHTPTFMVNKIWIRDLLEVVLSGFRDSSARRFHWFPHKLFRNRATPDNPHLKPERLFTDLPADLLRFYEDTYGVPASAAIIRWLKYDLMQKVWLLLFDAKFMHAVEHGVVVLCGDGIMRRVFPWIFMYLADYPEKCLVACLKPLARCACPDCTTDKSNFWRMGMKKDMADRMKNGRKDTGILQNLIARVRRWIFEDGTVPDGSSVKKTKLGFFSMAPVRSAFSRRFARFGDNFYKLFVPDLLHEFELGVWKGTFTHLLRILISAGRDGIQKLDERFSMIPTFGRATIRRFGDNTTGMKKLAARDFEQMLKSHTTLSYWTCSSSLPDGTLWQNCNCTRNQQSRTSTHHPAPLAKPCGRSCVMSVRRKAASGRNPQPATLSAKYKAFTVLNTYKYHRLGDYARGISETGTTDNKSTQAGEFEHRRVKQFYRRTNKNRTFGRQIALEVRRADLINKIKQGQGESHQPHHKRRKPKKTRAARGRRLHLRFQDTQPLPPTQPDRHYHVSDETRYPIKLDDFLYENEGDPACEKFEWKLKAHLFYRMPRREALPPDYIPDYRDIFSIRIENNKLYRHKVLRINYTTYDMRRDQDSVNPRTHPDIMMLAPEGAAHPYLYAWVIGIFHVEAFCAGDDLDGVDDTDMQSVHVLWVRWFDIDSQAPGGFKARRLPRLKWAALDDDAFGFVSPDQVLRGAHLMPAFAHGQSDSALPGYSIARQEEEEDVDWDYHYVGIFADRDMFMRYHGGAVGHQRGEPGRRHPPPAVPEEITPLAGNWYAEDEYEADEMGYNEGEQLMELDGDEQQDGEHMVNSEGDEEDNEEDNEEDDADTEEDDDLDFGPEDGEVGLGDDELELAQAGFAPL